MVDRTLTAIWLSIVMTGCAVKFHDYPVGELKSASQDSTTGSGGSAQAGRSNSDTGAAGGSVAGAAGTGDAEAGVGQAGSDSESGSAGASGIPGTTSDAQTCEGNCAGYICGSVIDSCGEVHVCGPEYFYDSQYDYPYDAGSGVGCTADHPYLWKCGVDLPGGSAPQADCIRYERTASPRSAAWCCTEPA